MKITSVTQLHGGGYIIECDEGTFNVIDSPGNRHYDAMIEWASNGGEIIIEPAPPTPVPQAVSRFQARAVLHLAGLLPAVEAYMVDPETDMLMKLAWTDAQEFRRDSPTIAAVAASLEITETQLDDLFTQAAQIVA